MGFLSPIQKFISPRAQNVRLYISRDETVLSLCSFVLVVSVKDRDRRAILNKITTLFGTSDPPALPNDHDNTSKASRAFTLRPHLSAMRLGAGVQLHFKSEQGVHLTPILERNAPWSNAPWSKDLPRCRAKSTCDSSRSSVYFTARKAVFVMEKRGRLT